MSVHRKSRRSPNPGVWVRSSMAYLDRALADWPVDRAGREEVLGAQRLLNASLRRLDELPDLVAR